MTYCWRTQKCRNLCIPHAFFEGKKGNTAKVALSTLFIRIEQSWRLCSSVKFVGLCIARSSSVPETCNHSQGEFSAIAHRVYSMLHAWGRQAADTRG